MGGPGFADSNAPLRRDYPQENELLISLVDGRAEGTDTLYEVALELRYGYSDYCTLDGWAIWVNTILVVTPHATLKERDCELSVHRQGTNLRLADYGGKCTQALCTTTAGQLETVESSPV